VQFLFEPLFGRVTPLTLLEGAAGVFVLATVWSLITKPRRQRVVPKRCASCDWQGAVMPSTAACPRCNKALP
jgi:hypothetical protein